MKSVSIFTLVLAASLFGGRLSFAQNWQYHSTARFVIAYAPQERTFALQVLDHLQQQQQQLSEALNFAPQRAITVFLCPTQTSFDRLTAGAVPHWGEAAASPTAWQIFLKSPRASAKGDLEIATLRHELVHLMLAEMIEPHRPPRWFDEGAAMLLSGETRHLNPTLISSALVTRSLISFDEIEALLSFRSARAGLAYAESYHAVNFLIKIHGGQAIREYARALAVQGDEREAFQLAFGADLWDFEVAYFNYLRDNFRWYFLFDDTVIFGAALVILFIAGLIVTRRRIKKKLREWEQEETHHPDDGLHLKGES